MHFSKVRASSRQGITIDISVVLFSESMVKQRLKLLFRHRVNRFSSPMNEPNTKKNLRFQNPWIPFLFGLFLFLVWLVSHLVYIPQKGIQKKPPQVTSGDEPHYLMVVNSILFDRDLTLQEDYFRVR